MKDQLRARESCNVNTRIDVNTDGTNLPTLCVENRREPGHELSPIVADRLVKRGGNSPFAVETERLQHRTATLLDLRPI